MHLASSLSYRARRASGPLRRMMERLSSGYRVNRAADDAAGLAVATNCGVVARSKRQAMRNIQDGLCALDTADGGLGQISRHLVRLRELAVAAASETITDGSRQHLQDEYQQLVASISAVAETTTWNGAPLLSFQTVDVGLVIDLSGSMGGEIAQVKASITDFRQTFLDAGLNVGLGLAAMGMDNTDGVTLLADIGSGDFMTELDALGVVGSASMSPYSALLNASGAQDDPGDDDPDAFSWHANTTRRVLILITDTGRERALVSDDQASTAAKLAANDVEVHTVNQPGHNGTYSTITSDTGGQYWDIGNYYGDGISAALSSIAEDLGGEFGTDITTSVQVSHGSGEDSRIEVELPCDATAGGLGLDVCSVATRDDALEALDAIDEAIASVSENRATVGAATNRLEAALGAEAQATEAMDAARSRIIDADYAAETAALVAAQIMSQASVAMCAQANLLERAHAQQLLDSMLSHSLERGAGSEAA